MAILPFLIIGLVQAGVSLDRVNKFINNPELDPKSVTHDPEIQDPILIEDGTFKWGEDEPEILKDINITVKKGSLTAVVGTVGAGQLTISPIHIDFNTKRTFDLYAVQSTWKLFYYKWTKCNLLVLQNVTNLTQNSLRPTSMLPKSFQR